MWGSNGSDWIYRGQRDANWRLLPKAFRPDSPMSFKFTNVIGVSDNKRYQFENELALLLDFVNSADSLGLRIPGDSFRIRTPKGMQEIDNSYKNNIWPPGFL
jgi:hypothetical protein